MSGPAPWHALLAPILWSPALFTSLLSWPAPTFWVHLFEPTSSPGVSASHQWPEPGEDGAMLLAAPAAAQVGISVEPAAELAAKEGSRLGDKLDFGRRVGLDLFHFLEVRTCHTSRCMFEGRGFAEAAACGKPFVPGMCSA
jgi:hypothetical protein